MRARGGHDPREAVLSVKDLVIKTVIAREDLEPVEGDVPANLLERGRQPDFGLVDHVAREDHHVELAEPAGWHERQRIAARCGPPVVVKIGNDEEPGHYGVSPQQAGAAVGSCHRR
jgi:hypothetical protein